MNFKSLDIKNIEISLDGDRDGKITITYRDGTKKTSNHHVEKDANVSPDEFCMIALANALDFEPAETLNFPVFLDEEDD